ncbi:MAG: ABC transporter substrate-binding protein [Armatimonadota bacterium]|nr:ABC transporter substrate-binding protein [Armatimonadota bacterium]MDR7533253.1 ABC transporter substrate-binding protein [Armatimonadota bacterium]MDR7536954.1 ABC transporter substrate-binding protein [Armatimonadota bacterium]
MTNDRTAGTRAVFRRDLLRYGAAGAGALLTSSASAWARLALAGPQPAAEPKKGGTLVIAWEADPGVLVPGLSTGGATVRALVLMYDSLVHEDLTKPAGQVDSPPITPGLAERWTISPDGMTYTFTLRRGVKFHDGTEVDAEAVKFNFDRAIDERHPFFDATLRSINFSLVGYRVIKETRVVDRYTFQLLLTEPFPSLLRNLATRTTGIVSPTAIRRLGKDRFALAPVGSGPFKFVEQERGVKVVLERNPDYWGGAPLLDRVVIRPIIEAASRVAALVAGEVDVMVVIPPDSVHQLRFNRSIQVAFAGPPHIWFWMLNCRATPTRDRRVRQALNYAVNREGLVKDILRNTATVARGPFPPGNPGYAKDNVAGYTYDPARARRLLAEAGFPQGFEMKCFYPASGTGMMVPTPMNEYIQANLRDVGVRVSFDVLEFGAFIAKARLGLDDETGALQTSWSSNDPWWLESMFHSDLHPPKGNVRTWYKNPEVDRLLDQARRELNEARRLQLYRQAEKIIVDDAPWIFVCHDRSPIAYRAKVQNFVAPPSWNFDLRQVWLR